MPTFIQDDRPIAVETPLGKDVLALASFSGEEKLSGLFHFRLDMISEKSGIKPNDIVGKQVDFFVRYPDEEPRYFNGFVNWFGYMGAGDRGHIYRAEVVPWLWFLTKASDCFVHETQKQQGVKEIVDKVFQKFGFSDYRWDLKRQPPKRDLCIQYQETYFNFVSRLLEEEGIFYYFQHEKGKHTLVLGDHPGAWQDCRDGEVQLLANLSQPEITDQLSAWDHQYQYVSGKAAHTDYNFEEPRTNLLATTKSLVSLPKNSGYELYEHPGDYMKKPAGEALVKLRMEEEEAGYDVVQGASECRSFSPGGRFKLNKHHTESEAGGKWTLTAVRHECHLGGSYIPGAAPAQDIYKNSFKCIPADTKYRPPRITEKPRISGIQTATVVGPGSDEIYTDKYGRIRIQFHWDREGKRDEKSSCWIRTSNPWTGNKWGWIHIPRVGYEVVVDFLDGDPDRPLVTGMLYNGDNMPPYTLPDNKTQSGIKTHSTSGGGDDNFNEIRFEDKMDEEEIYVHAEKDFNCVIENNETRRVGFEKQNPGDQTIEVSNDRNILVDRGDETIELNKGSRSITVSQGDQKTHIQLGSCETEAMQAIELKVGANSIKIDQAGITIKGIMVKIEGTAMADIKAPMTNVNGTGMLTLKGGVLMIN